MHTANTWKQVCRSYKTKIELSGLHAECVQEKLHVVRNMNVTTSCCGNIFLQQGQRSWSEFIGKMDGDKYWAILEENLLEAPEVHLPAGQQPYSYSHSYNDMFWLNA
ncbi:hypothetical protein ILYODFUR_017272 [Ilyodon furcidens]|uniref:Uncharacterized protein n=1 Tax=Ilyodon furcidens TaxID=33524 RepID=A0ABV0SPD1_9TELE